MFDQIMNLWTGPLKLSINRFGWFTYSPTHDLGGAQFFFFLFNKFDLESKVEIKDVGANC